MWEISNKTLSFPLTFISLSIDLATMSLGARSALELYFFMKGIPEVVFKIAPSPLKASEIKKDFASG